jgi:aspartyl-tRNA(Asn)/glutamyl-tRNA(Gln) amidotransferase subunit B
LNKAGKAIEESPVSPAQLGGVIDLIGRHHLRQDRQGPVRDRLERGRRPERTSKAADEAGHRHRRHREGGGRCHRRQPDKVEQVKAKPTMAGWFVGQVMKATGGKANPQVVNDLVKAKLGLSDVRSHRVRTRHSGDQSPAG